MTDDNFSTLISSPDSHSDCFGYPAIIKMQKVLQLVRQKLIVPTIFIFFEKWDTDEKDLTSQSNCWAVSWAGLSEPLKRQDPCSGKDSSSLSN